VGRPRLPAMSQDEGGEKPPKRKTVGESFLDLARFEGPKIPDDLLPKI